MGRLTHVCLIFISKLIAQMETQKKPYQAPELNVYGTVESLTKQGGRPNSDVFHGPTGTAYSAIG